ncbi:hypothetical protein OIU79_030922 [Salix purpurea]|uniref:Uncharacterized protein n=1 Tax=Salix purpurea TaxID=77065 RepID=A0A9Q0VAC1_SALPP|nr:hypothetical protein OIU79_030922 [Salix purpurea]
MSCFESRHNLPVRLPEQLHNQPIVGLTDRSLVELVWVEHSPAGWLVQLTPDSHNLHCLQLAAQDNLAQIEKAQIMET